MNLAVNFAYTHSMAEGFWNLKVVLLDLEELIVGKPLTQNFKHVCIFEKFAKLGTEADVGPVFIGKWLDWIICQKLLKKCYSGVMDW